MPQPVVAAIEGLERQWFKPRSEVILRLVAESLADYERVSAIGQQVATMERLRSDVADLQDKVAETDRANHELQKALEKAQADLAEAQGIRKRTAHGKWITILGRAVNLHPEVAHLAEQERAGKNVSTGRELLRHCYAEYRSWVKVQEAIRAAA